MAKKEIKVWLGRESTLSVKGSTPGKTDSIAYGESFDTSRVNKDLLKKLIKNNLVGDTVVTEKDISDKVSSQIDEQIEELCKTHEQEIHDLTKKNLDSYQQLVLDNGNEREELIKSNATAIKDLTESHDKIVEKLEKQAGKDKDLIKNLKTQLEDFKGVQK